MLFYTANLFKSNAIYTSLIVIVFLSMGVGGVWDEDGGG